MTAASNQQGAEGDVTNRALALPLGLVQHRFVQVHKVR